MATALAELLGLAVLDLAAILAIALPIRLDPLRQRWPWERAWARLTWATRNSALLASPAVRFVVSGVLVLTLLVWLALAFRDDLAITIAMLLEITGITLLAIEVLTGHESERYDGVMTEALDIRNLYEIDKWQFLVSTLSLIPAAMQRVDAEIARVNRLSGTANWATSGNAALIAAELMKSNLKSINAAAGILRTIGREASPEDLRDSAKNVHEWLGDLFAEAKDWHDGRKDRVFASRRWRLYGGVVLLVLAGVLHSWHLLQLHID